MQVEVKVPQLSESVSEATLVAWRKKAGEPVKRDENLIDVETDKVVLELPAPADGVLAKIIKKDGDSVTSGEIIAMIDTEAKGAAAAPAAAPKDEKRAANPAPSPAGKEPAPASGGGSASPSATKIAAEKGIDTSTVQGTGRDGRVTKSDVMDASQSAKQSPTPPRPQTPTPPVFTGNRAEQRVP